MASLTKNIAPAYSASAQYSEGDFVLFAGKLYRANETTTGTFDTSKWTEIFLSDLVRGNSNLGNDEQCLLSFLISNAVGAVYTYDWKNVYYNKNFLTFGTNSVTVKKACKISKYSYAFTLQKNNAVIYVNNNPVIELTASGLQNDVACDIQLNIGDVITSVQNLGASSADFAISLVLK